MKSTEIDSYIKEWFMEKKLYTSVRTLYINDKPVSDHYFGNLRYGELTTHNTPIKDFKDLYNTVNSSDMRYLSIKFRRGFKKIKVNGRTFRKEDVKDIYLLDQSEELREDCFSFVDLARRLTTPEFIEFCKDKGLSVKFLKEEKIYN